MKGEGEGEKGKNIGQKCDVYRYQLTTMNASVYSQKIRLEAGEGGKELPY